MDGVKKFSWWEGPPLNKGHDEGSIPDKIFRFGYMKNHLLQGFMRESGPFLALEWNAIKLLLITIKFDEKLNNLYLINYLGIFRFWFSSWKTSRVLFMRPMAGSKMIWKEVKNFAWWGSDPLGPPPPHLAKLWLASFLDENAFWRVGGRRAFSPTLFGTGETRLFYLKSIPSPSCWSCITIDTSADRVDQNHFDLRMRYWILKSCQLWQIFLRPCLHWNLCHWHKCHVSLQCM